MKRLVLIAALFVVGISQAKAQDHTVTSKQIDYYNNVELGAGFVSFANVIGSFALSLSGIDGGSTDLYDVSAEHHALPAINFGYSRQLTPVINFGVILSYTQVNADIILRSTGAKAGSSLFGSVAIVPTVRFDWFRRPYFRCYSRVSAGVADYFGRDTYYDDSQKNMSEDTILPSLDCVPLGIAVGRKLYGFGEVSFGTLGFVKVGMGYRF